jgi:hypothetical protein
MARDKVLPDWTRHDYRVAGQRLERAGLLRRVAQGRHGVPMQYVLVPITTRRPLHKRIADNGGGAFSHWGRYLIFSSTDNSDPRTNGRRYAVDYDYELSKRLRSFAGFHTTVDSSNPSEIYQVALDRPLTRGGNVEEVCSEIRALAERSLTEEQRYMLAERLAYAAYPKYKFSDYSRIFLEDQQFLKYYTSHMDPGNWHSLDRKFTLNELLKLVAHIDGDIAECGVYKGFSSYLMCRSLAGTPWLVHLFDSFEGLPEPLPVDGSYWRKGDMSATEKALHQTLRDYNNYRVHRGWIPNKFGEVATQTFRFVHIDVDLFEPTHESLEFFYPRLNRGGVILFDDYGCSTCPGAKKVTDSFSQTSPSLSRCSRLGRPW